MAIKVIKNPKTGKSETVEVPDFDQKALADLHKEVKDMLDGNIQFHDDPNTPPKPKPEVTEASDDDQQDFWYNHIYP